MSKVSISSAPAPSRAQAFLASFPPPECSTPWSPTPSPMTRHGFARPADSAACREMIRGGSRAFFLASLLLPESVRGAAYALYGFCRLSDDAVDVEGGQMGAVSRLRTRLDCIYAGAPAPEPVDRALADAVAVFGIPRVALEALLEGLEWDVEGRAYETIFAEFEGAKHTDAAGQSLGPTTKFNIYSSSKAYTSLGRATVKAQWVPSPCIANGKLILRMKDKVKAWAQTP